MNYYLIPYTRPLIALLKLTNTFIAMAFDVVPWQSTEAFAPYSTVKTTKKNPFGPAPPSV